MMDSLNVRTSIIAGCAVLASLTFSAIPAQAAEGGTISGTVVGQAGNARAGVSVQLYEWQSMEFGPVPVPHGDPVTTGTDGTYRFDGLTVNGTPEGETWELSFSDSSGECGNNVLIDSPEGTNDFNEVAAPVACADGSITGAVIDQTGAPVSDALVILRSSSGTQLRETHTSGTGSYAFARQANGTYSVEARVPDPFIPNYDHSCGSVQVTVTDDLAPTAANNVACAELDNTVRGQVVNANGDPWDGATVTLVYRDEGNAVANEGGSPWFDSSRVVTTGADGRWEFSGLSDNQYRFLIMAEQGGSRGCTGSNWQNPASVSGGQTYTYPADVCPYLDAAGPLETTATVGEPMSINYTAAGGAAPYRFTASGLPAGLSITTDGRVQGTPVQTGDAAATITVTDADNATATLKATIHIVPFSDTTPPSAPSATIITGRTASSLTVEWSAATDNVDVTGYKVYLDGALSTSFGASARTTTLGGLGPSTSHTVSVRAVDAAGNEGTAATVTGSTNASPGANPTPVPTPTPIPTAPPAPVGKTFIGTAKKDVIQGTPGDDIIIAKAGNDIVYGNGGNDVIVGGTGNDKLFGGDGDDTIKGGAGRDKCDGGPGTDTAARSCEKRIAVP